MKRAVFEVDLKDAAYQSFFFPGGGGLVFGTRPRRAEALRFARDSKDTFFAVRFLTFLTAFLTTFFTAFLTDFFEAVLAGFRAALLVRFLLSLEAAFPDFFLTAFLETMHVLRQNRDLLAGPGGLRTSC